MATQANLINISLGNAIWPGVFGDGSMGATTITGLVTLPRDAYHTNLTITSSGFINSNGYRIFVSEHLQIEGEINRDGGNGVDGNPSGPLARVVGGGADGGDQAIDVGNDGASISPSLGGAGGNGGGSGYYPPGLGGGVSFVNSVGGPSNQKQITNILRSLITVTVRLTGGAGGGSGSGGWPFDIGIGKNGGGGGGVIYIAAKTIGGSGLISAKGGDGDVVGDPAFDGPGGGGGGGVIVLISQSIASTVRTNVAGGIGEQQGALVFASDGDPGTVIRASI